MDNVSMTALVSAFARAYHARENKVKIYDDSLAYDILGKEQYDEISMQMTNGINFFAPDFTGDEKQALRFIVDEQLAPQPLARAAFAQNALERNVKIGAKQCLILGAGYDTFAYRQEEWAKKLEIFELDHPLTAQDKRRRLKNANIAIPENVHYIEVDIAKDDFIQRVLNCGAYDADKKTFCTMLGLTMYFSKDDFSRLLYRLNSLMPKYSTVVFDYMACPSEGDYVGESTKKQRMLAKGANEAMKASYCYEEMEKLLSDNGFLIYEHLDQNEMTGQYFTKYNAANAGRKMQAFESVNYCLAVKNG